MTESNRLRRAGFGGVLIGWGIFNFTEGLINHHILGIHHVRNWGPYPIWDFGFLLSGPLLAGLGWHLVRSGARGKVEEQYSKGCKLTHKKTDVENE